MQLAQALGIDGRDLVYVRRGALLHDIGKIGVPDSILRKRGPLTAEEWQIMRQHPTLSHDMLWPIQYLRPAIDIPYCHHEKWDGTGYPIGLRADDIPLVARICAVCDVFDALVSDRPYKGAWTTADALAEIERIAGQHLDPRLAGLFFEHRCDLRAGE